MTTNKGTFCITRCCKVWNWLKKLPSLEKGEAGWGVQLFTRFEKSCVNFEQNKRFPVVQLSFNFHFSYLNCVFHSWSEPPYQLLSVVRSILKWNHTIWFFFSGRSSFKFRMVAVTKLQIPIWLVKQFFYKITISNFNVKPTIQMLKLKYLVLKGTRKSNKITYSYEKLLKH